MITRDADSERWKPGGRNSWNAVWAPHVDNRPCLWVLPSCFRVLLGRGLKGWCLISPPQERRLTDAAGSPMLSILVPPLCSPRGPFRSCPSSLAELGSPHAPSQAWPQMLLAVPQMLHPALRPHIHAPAVPLASEAPCSCPYALFSSQILLIPQNWDERAPSPGSLLWPSISWWNAFREYSQYFIITINGGNIILKNCETLCCIPEMYISK